MRPGVTSDPGESFAWATLVIVLVVLLCVVAVAYFAWWQPSHRITVVVSPRVSTTSPPATSAPRPQAPNASGGGKTGPSGQNPSQGPSPEPGGGLNHSQGNAGQERIERPSESLENTFSRAHNSARLDTIWAKPPRGIFKGCPCYERSYRLNGPKE